MDAKDKGTIKVYKCNSNGVNPIELNKEENSK